MSFTLFLSAYTAPLLVGFFGLLTGSYLNSWIWRVRHNVWRLAGRSTCIHCLRELAWFENIPLVSFVALGGRCRTCRKRIPGHYFFVELITAVLFFAVTWYHQALPVLNTWHFFRDIFFSVVLLVVFMYDYLYMEILPSVVWAGSVMAIVLNYGALHQSPVSLILGCFIGGGFFLAQYLVSKGRWIGGGDVRLGVMMGLLLGFPTILVALFISYMLGAGVSHDLLATRQKAVGDAIPFGTFLAVGTLISLLFGSAIVSWYGGFFV
jgi:prepilin signal peptidase PulO-like enzyme (type II secretory pathway)